MQSYSRLVGSCSGLGGSYNPVSQNLHIESLTTQLENARQANEEAKVARTSYDNEVNHRRAVYDGLPKLASSILRVLESTGAAPEKLDDARGFVHQLIGRSPRARVAVPAEEGTEAPAKSRRSGLQLAYVSKADSFSKLVLAVTTEPRYGANEEGLSATGLTEKVRELDQLNGRVSEARKAWSNATIRRNELMYSNPDSLYATARAVKKYLRAVLGPGSERYAQVKSMVFTKPRK